MQLFLGEGLGEKSRLWSLGTKNKCAQVLTAFWTRAPALRALNLQSVQNCPPCLFIISYLSSHLSFLLYSVSSFSLFRGQGKCKKSNYLDSGSLMAFQGCLHKYLCFLLKVLKVHYACGPIPLWHQLFLEVQDIIL